MFALAIAYLEDGSAVLAIGKTEPETRVRFTPGQPIRWDAPEPKAGVIGSAAFLPGTDGGHVLRQITARLGMKASERCPVDVASRVAPMITYSGQTYQGAL